MTADSAFLVPDRFRNSVALHVLKQVCRVPGVAVPLVLGIHGPAGTGKTFQCELVLKEMSARTFLISGGQLESAEAGEPAALLRRTYLAASESVQRNQCVHAVIVINDFDTGGGKWGDLVQYTVNSQILFGELMHLCDFPQCVDKTSTERIPIIITGNDFTRLYAPLVRAGRMTTFEWCPTVPELTEVLRPIYPALNRSDREQLVRAFPSKPISFYAHLKGLLFDEMLLQMLSNDSAQGVILSLRLSNDDMSPDYDLQSLLLLGKQLETSAELKDHINGKALV